MLGERHEAAAGELAGWWAGLRQRGSGSRAVLLAVPPGWGRTTVLDRLAAVAAAPGAPATLVARIHGRSLPGASGLQALLLRDCLMEAGVRQRAAELLCLDRLGGTAAPGAPPDRGRLFASGLAAAVSFLLAGVAAGTAATAETAGVAETADAAAQDWDDGPAGENGPVARAARAAAAVSVSVPVVVMIDDADSLDPDLAATLIQSLIDRHDSRVLVVAVVDPGSGLTSALTSRARSGPTGGRVHKAAADPRMGEKSRADLARELCPGLPDAATRLIARRTATFAEVFAVAGSARLAEAVRASQGRAGAAVPAAVLASVGAVVEAVIAAGAQLEPPSAEAVAVAWAGGLVHVRQASRALGVLGAERVADDGDLLRLESLARLADPGCPRLAERVAALTPGTRQALAAAVLDEAVAITADPAAELVSRVVAVQAAHRVRDDLDDGDREELSAVVLRLASTLPAAHEDPLVAEMITAAADTVAAGLMARR